MADSILVQQFLKQFNKMFSAFILSDSRNVCRDMCTGVAILPTDCVNKKYCCLNSNKLCVLRQVKAGQSFFFSSADYTAQKKLRADFVDSQILPEKLLFRHH